MGRYYREPPCNSCEKDYNNPHTCDEPAFCSCEGLHIKHVVLHTTEGEVLNAYKSIGNYADERMKKAMNDYGYGVEMKTVAVKNSMLSDRFSDLDSAIQRLNDLAFQLQEKLEPILTRSDEIRDREGTAPSVDPSRTPLESTLNGVFYRLQELGDRLHELNQRVDL